jgi:transcriptional regulator with XRE-family HTH domain
MADTLGVAMRTYQNYEKDRVPWRLMGRISDITGRSLRWLLHGEDDSEPSAEVVQRLAAVEAKLDIVLAQLRGDEENPTGRRLRAGGLVDSGDPAAS